MVAKANRVVANSAANPKPCMVSAWSRNSRNLSVRLFSAYGSTWMKTSRLFSGYWLNTRAPTKERAASSGTTDRMVTKARAEAVRKIESS